MSFHFMSTDVEIVAADSPWPAADALFVPTNDYLWMAEGPALEVKKKAGEEVELEAVRQGPVALGEVVTTGSGSMPFSCVLHGAVMGQDLHVDGQAARQAIQRGVRLAGQKRWERLLVHSLLGTGKGTPREAVSEMLGALVDELLEGQQLRCVTLLAIEESERAVLHEIILHIIQSQG